MAFLFPQPCPELPEYQSLLLKGPYHASAPVHLLLSHALTNPDAKAILLTPSRVSFKDALVDLNDEWLDHNSGHGRVASASRGTDIYYPPTLAHLRLLLSMLHEYDTTVHHEKTTLDAAPGLLVLHEISSYFDTASSETTVCAYLSVISSALALTNSWSPRHPTGKTSKLVVFDSGLAELKLPILRPLSFEDQTHDVQRHRDALSVLLERYFEWRADAQVHEEAQLGKDQTDDNEGEASPPVARSLTLKRGRGGEDGEGMVWHWTEAHHYRENGRPCTSFHWDESES